MTLLEQQMEIELKEMSDRVLMVKEINERLNQEMEITGKRLEVKVEKKKIPIAFYPTEKKNAPIIFAFHGGGFCFGGNCMEDRMYDMLRTRLAVNVVSVDYTKNVGFPIALDDCFKCMMAIVNDNTFDFDRNDISVFGSSAGANLAIGVSILAFREQKVKIKKRLLNYPYVDLETDPREKGSQGDGLVGEVYYAWKYAGELDRKDPLISPLYGGAEDFDPKTETIIILADIDTLHDEGEKMAQRFKELGGKCECFTSKGMGHGYFEYGYKDWPAFVPPLIKAAEENGTLRPAVELATQRFIDFYQS